VLVGGEAAARTDPVTQAKTIAAHAAMRPTRFGAEGNAKDTRLVDKSFPILSS